MTEQSNVAAARACYEAYVSMDRAAIEVLIAQDFHFTSPRDNRIDRHAYFERCWPGGQDIEAFEFVHLAPAGDRVFVTYEALMRGGRRFRNTEILRLRDGRIIEVEVYFGWSLPHAAPDGGFVDGQA
jgi:ketosteroid isomerase-like protein